jgi:hypothetical protein
MNDASGEIRVRVRRRHHRDPEPPRPAAEKPVPVDPRRRRLLSIALGLFALSLLAAGALLGGTAGGLGTIRASVTFDGQTLTVTNDNDFSWEAGSIHYQPFGGGSARRGFGALAPGESVMIPVEGASGTGADGETHGGAGIVGIHCGVPSWGPVGVWIGTP